MPTYILQLSDLHVFAEPGQRVRGVLTRESLVEVLEAVRGTGLCFEHVVVSGDLTHDERRETYQVVREMLAEWLGCCHIIPGNHDDRALIREIFPDCTEGTDAGVTFSFATGRWRVIGIDTQSPGQVPGRVAPAMLEWLEQELAEHAGAPTLLFAHHPPVPVDSEWIDAIGLLDPEPLQELVRRSPQVRVVSCGHVHQDFCGSLGTAVVLTVPSTAVQFTPLIAEGVVDHIPPGFRIFSLDGDNWSTRVVRLSEVRHPVEDR